MLKGTNGTPKVLKEPFPSQQTQMVEQLSPSTPFGSQVFMMNGAAPISVATRSKDYNESRQAPGKVVADGPPPPPISGSLEIEKPTPEPIVKPSSKGVLRRSSYNPNARAAQHYSIVEDLAQAPSAMSVLEVLQSCPSQRKALLSAIGGIDPADSSLLTFDLDNFTPSFHIKSLLLFKSGSTVLTFIGPSWMKVPLPALCPPLAGRPSALQPFRHLPMP